MNAKINRKKLLKEPDEFLSFSTRMIQWGMERKKTILIAFCSILTAVMIASGIGYYLRSSEERASAALYQETSRYETLRRDSGEQTAFQQVQSGLERIAEEFSGKAAAKHALLILGNISLAAMDTEKAVAYYTRAMAAFEDRPYYKALIASALGHTWLARQAPDKALPYFQTVLSVPDAPGLDDALFQLATIYRNQGNQEKSRELYQRLSTEFADSPFHPIAQAYTRG